MMAIFILRATTASVISTFAPGSVARGIFFFQLHRYLGLYITRYFLILVDEILGYIYLLSQLA